MKRASILALVGLGTTILLGCDTLGPEDVASVTVSPAEADVVVGRTVQLSATLKDDQGQVLEGLTVTWSSSNASVATVVDTTGLVSAVGLGSATITASIGQQSGSATITGTAGSVTVSPAADTIEIGATVQLAATVADADGNAISGAAIAWTSSDDSVATVDGTGLVTGVGTGSVTITATSGGKSDAATITVTGPVPAVSSVSPATGTVGTELTIVGTDFRTGAAVLLDTLSSDSVDVVADTLIFALVPAGVTVDETVAVTVRNADGTSFTLDSAFTAVAPTLDFVNSATKPSGQIGSTVIIEGDAFGDLQGTGKVLFSDGAGGTIEATISTEDDWTNTFIVTTVPSGTEDGDVVVQTATGTSNALPFKVTSSAVFSPSEINWTVTTDLPTAVSGHQAVFVPIDDATGTTIQYVHVTGGADDNGAPINKVYVGLINSDGTITTWPNTTDLPDVRAFHASVAATPFNSRVKGSGNLYVLGGINAAGGQPVTTVYRGTLNDDGTIASWSETTPLPVPLHSLGAVVFRSTIYVAGGATTDNAPVATVYRAQIDTTGELGAWEELPSLPSARSYHGFATFGGFLYSVGGETDTVAPSDGNFTNNDTKLDEVVFVKINLRTGALADSNWTINGNSLGKKRSKHSALVAGGNIFVSAGLYSGAGTGSSENTFAQIFSDGTVDAFGGATGSNTLLSEGGANLFSHAAISYIDANGVAHVMILGGDNVNDPGVKRVKVLFY